jgi:outer membrane immunogenic protein
LVFRTLWYCGDITEAILGINYARRWAGAFNFKAFLPLRSEGKKGSWDTEMKKILLAAAGLFAISALAPAMAADLAARPYTKAPAAAVVLSWTGFYVGAEGGGGWAKDDWTLPLAGGITAARTDISGATAGGVIGYNWQMPSNVVLGIEGNLDWADIAGTSTCISNPALTCRSRLDATYTVTGRLGYAFSSALLYVKGGGAWTNDKYTVITTATGALLESGSASRDGWTVGAGLEYMFAPNWSAKVEYDYYDFGNKSTLLVTPAGVGLDTVNSKLTVNTVKAGVNYHFNWGGPVVAKY